MACKEGTGTGEFRQLLLRNIVQLCLLIQIFMRKISRDELVRYIAFIDL
jgi:hypothetical protein